MGLITDFFVASDEELRRAYPGWSEVAPEPVERDFTNPFTGETQRIRQWVPVERGPEERQVADVDAEDFEFIKQLPLFQWKNLEAVKLTKLSIILCGGTFDDQLNALMGRPPLIVGHGDAGLCRLPQPWVDALAGLKELQPVAEQWSQTEEFALDNWTTEDGSEILHALRPLARAARAEGKGMYLFWCL